MADNKSARKSRVLVVDDEVVITRLLERQLQKLNCDPVVTSSAQSALELIEDDLQGFDLVVADLCMPGLSGLEMANLVHNKHPHLPIIISTGDDTPLIGLDLGLYGVVAVAHKPVTAAAFATLVAGALSKSQL